MKKITAILLFLIMLSAYNLKADPVLLRVPDTTMFVFDTIDLPVYADSSFTGEGVISYQLDFTFQKSYLDVLGVESTGTLSDGFGTISIGEISPGRIKIAAAGVTPLAGKGKLLYIKIKAKTNIGTYFSFTSGGDNYFNEGEPEMTTDNGYINIQAKPSININPTNVLLMVGEQQQFTASGGTAPYSWSVMTDSVASINSSGLLTALKRGKTKIIVSDNNGVIDTSYFEVEVRAVELSIHDTTGWQANPIMIPLYINDISGLGIKSGLIEITYYTTYLTFTGIENSGTLLDGKEVISGDPAPGKCTVVFASEDNISGSGVLIYLMFTIHNVTSGNTYLNFEDVLFNEDILAITDLGYISIQELPVLEISPSTAELNAGETQQFNVTNGQAPYIWETNDPSVATIDATGLLTAIKSGMVILTVTDNLGAIGESDEIIIYGAETTIPDTSISIDYCSGFTVPVRLSLLSAFEEILAFEMTINYDTSVFEQVEISRTGTLCENWAVVTNDLDGDIIMAGASATAINTNGILFNLEMSYKPDVSIGQNTSININDVFYNEGIPYTHTSGSNFEVGNILDKDLGVISISGPVSQCEPGVVSSIEITFQNYGSEPYLSCWPVYVAYNVNDGQEVVDTITLATDLLPGSTMDHLFSADYDFTTIGEYNLKAYTITSGDVDMDNDTTLLPIYTYAYPVVDLGADISTNDFPVVLDAGPGMDEYNWNDGSSNQTLNATTHGTYWVEVTLHGCSSSDTIVISPIIGIYYSDSRDAKIYPNPANNELFIEFKNEQQEFNWKIINILGEIVLASDEFAVNRNINISEIPEGTYILDINFNSNSEQLIFIIQR